MKVRGYWLSCVAAVACGAAPAVDDDDLVEPSESSAAGYSDANPLGLDLVGSATRRSGKPARRIAERYLGQHARRGSGPSAPPSRSRELATSAQGGHRRLHVTLQGGESRPPPRGAPALVARGGARVGGHLGSLRDQWGDRLGDFTVTNIARDLRNPSGRAILLWTGRHLGKRSMTGALSPRRRSVRRNDGAALQHWW